MDAAVHMRGYPPTARAHSGGSLESGLLNLSHAVTACSDRHSAYSVACYVHQTVAVGWFASLMGMLYVLQAVGLPHALKDRLLRPRVVILLGQFDFAGTPRSVYRPPGQYEPFSQLTHVFCADEDEYWPAGQLQV